MKKGANLRPIVPQLFSILLSDHFIVFDCVNPIKMVTRCFLLFRMALSEAFPNWMVYLIRTA